MSTYYIASLKHTHKGDEHIVWWSTNHCGYTPVLGERAGRYCYGEACELNDGRDYIAVPVEAVQKLMSPEPYFENRTGLHRWYDQRGPVVDNTRANWNAMLAARLLPERGQFKPKPQVFRGPRRAVHTAGELQAA
jgi:hypothetical protein